MPFPNKESQWKKGQSGNPNGKPKGSKHISTWIQDILNDEEFEVLLDSPINGQTEYKGAPLKAIIMVAVYKSISGDNRWADWLAKNGYGSSSTVDLNVKELPQPILGGISAIRGDNSSPETTET